MTNPELDTAENPREDMKKMRIFEGVYKDLKRKLPFYISDFKDGFDRKIIASALFMFFASILPGLTFGEYLTNETQRHYGNVEVILSTAVTGSIFALFAGQPLVIVGVTGPVSIFSKTVFDIADSIGVEFLPWMGWICIWAAIMHIILAISNATSLVRLVTRFSGETFGILIAWIYIATAIRDFDEFFKEESVPSAVLSLLVGLLTFWVAMTLHGARGWVYFNKAVRGVLADYGAAMSIFLFTGFTYLPRIKDITVPRLSDQLPDRFEPTLQVPTGVGNETAPRDWLVDMSDMPVWGVFAAILPAIVLTVLFFFDHNVSSLLSQKEEFKLRKGSAYHWDFFVIGLMILLCGFIGVPPVNGLIPQAPLHVRSLAKLREEVVNGHKREIYIRVREQRVSALLQSVAIGAMLAILNVLGTIPIAVLSGLFLYMGFASFIGNQFAERVKLIYTDKNRQEPASYIAYCTHRTILKYTAIQSACFLLIFGITFTPAAISFPIFILLLVPMRSYYFPKIFTPRDLDELDSPELKDHVHADEDGNYPPYPGTPEAQEAEREAIQKLQRESEAGMEMTLLGAGSVDRSDSLATSRDIDPATGIETQVTMF